MQTVVYDLDGKLYINLTNRCSNRCAFCIRVKHDGIGSHKLWLEHEPTAAEVIDALEKVDLTQYQQVVYCGFGEPIIRLDAIKQISPYLRQFPVRIRINTNGQGNLIHGRDITPELKGLLDIVSISLNAPDAQKYQAVCHSVYGEEAYAGLLDFAQKCKAQGLETVLSIVDVMPKKDIEACKARCNALGIRLRIRHNIA
nr:TatD family nuclease-associated radical SAM protein [Maliibacterium massiliense]